MKRLFMPLAAVLAMLFIPAAANAQKKALDHDVYDSWQRISKTVMSPDGKVIIYSVSPQEGDDELMIKQLDAHACEIGSLSIPRGTGVRITDDSKWAVVRIKAPFEETRKARIAKKKGDQMPKDSLVYINLSTLEITSLGVNTPYNFPQRGRALIAYDSKVNPAPVPKDTSKIKALSDSSKAKAKPSPKRPDIKCLVLLDPATGHADTLRKVSSYTFDRDGRRLAVIYKKEPKDSLSADKVVLYNLPSMDSTVLDQGRKFYSLPNFNIDGDKLTFLASTDSNATGSKRCAVMLTEEVTAGKGRKAVSSIVTRELIPQDYQPREGWCIPTNAAPAFTADDKRIILGVAELVPPKDTTIIEFESAQLDIWNWDVYMTPTMQRLNNNAIKDATCKSVIELDNPGKLVQLTDVLEETVTPLNAGRSDWALAIDTRPYQLSSTWDSNTYTDCYLVNMKDGSRKTLAVKLDGKPYPSPTGRYLTWYDRSDLNWYCHDMTTGKTVNLTAGLDAMFYNDEDDHPAPKPSFDSPRWLDGDCAMLLAEKYDIWRLTPDGRKAECLTKGEGRATGTQYRILGMNFSRITKEEAAAGVRSSYGVKDTVYLTAYNRVSKENGFARVLASKPGLISSFTTPASFSGISMADCNNGMIAFLKGDVHHSNDQYVTSDFWTGATKLSSINPQQAEYNWGDVQLVHWQAYDGTPLDGLLYTPEDLDPAGKYPMMVYFYEKNSQNLFNYISPSPSRSVINPIFYASRGYVVFIPDIVYRDGHPGESAYNCICSGAEAMCDRFRFIDKSRMAIQGQSWGGYQTAYLVTRTDMFAAAGAGAPVGNMTSAYGGMRWGSGVVRAMQYEHGQSRIGKNMWEDGGLELYIENSPVFHTENVTTPVLIMHNDDDGAVPWYQGIEFFMALRRFSHPAWLLQYNGEAHNLTQRRNCKDLSRRLQQFFDHYLKGDPMPAWMKTGVPYSRKGQYYGFEYPGEEQVPNDGK